MLRAQLVDHGAHLERERAIHVRPGASGNSHHLELGAPLALADRVQHRLLRAVAELHRTFSPNHEQGVLGTHELGGRADALRQAGTAGLGRVSTSAAPVSWMRSALLRPACAPGPLSSRSTRSWAKPGKPANTGAQDDCGFCLQPSHASPHNSNRVGKLVNIRAEQAHAAGEPEDLIDACRRGERRALETVFTTHGPYLERLLARLVGPSLEVEDLLQSTFVAAIGAFARFRGEAQVRTWLARIAIRVAQERLRRAEHRRRGDLPGLEESEDSRVPHAHAENDLDARRRIERLHGHLTLIAPKKRIAFVLHVFEGHPIEEVAALTGASVTATKSRGVLGASRAAQAGRARSAAAGSGRSRRRSVMKQLGCPAGRHVAGSARSRLIGCRGVAARGASFELRTV